MAEKMSAVRKMKPAPGLELTEAEIPKIGDNEVLVKVRACSFCGTDIHIYNWDPPWSEGRMKTPRTIGHEIAGNIIEVGKNITNFNAGDFISCESHIWCGECDQCREGNAHICRKLSFIGVDIDGGMADYVAVPKQILWKNPKNMPVELAVLQESLGNSVYTVFEGEIVGKTVAIFGHGPTGLFSVGLAKIGGATNIIVVGGNETRLGIAKKMGADVLINRKEKDPIKEIMEITNGEGVDVSLEMAGYESSINHSLKVLRPGGRISFLGLPTKPVTIDWSKDVVLRDAKVQGIYGRKLFDTWRITSRLLHSGRLDITPIITHKFKLSEFEKAMEVAKSGSAGKVIMFPE
jgi:threonine 3-dehydrogenase